MGGGDVVPKVSCCSPARAKMLYRSVGSTVVSVHDAFGLLLLIPLDLWSPDASCTGLCDPAKQPSLHYENCVPASRIANFGIRDYCEISNVDAKSSRPRPNSYILVPQLSNYGQRLLNQRYMLRSGAQLAYQATVR